MSPQPVVHEDVEAWLAAWIRERRARVTEGLSLTLAWVSNRERPDAHGGSVKSGEVHALIRDDSGSRRDLVLKDASVGVTLIGDASELAAVRRAAERLVALIEAEAPIDAGPVADVPDVLGPYTIQSGNDEARLYAALQLTLVGSPL